MKCPKCGSDDVATDNEGIYCYVCEELFSWHLIDEWNRRLRGLNEK